jgi:formylglycine-generating enzyme required for sulfatase activity
MYLDPDALANDAPADGSAWLEKDGGDCDRRVVRGGSWIDIPLILRSAGRDGYYTDNTGSGVGFRIARAL